MNPILLDLGIIKIYWYTVMIFLGMLLGGYLIIKETKKYGISEEKMIDLFFYLIPLSILSARIYYVIFEFETFRNDIISIFKIWEGGLAIHGGIIAALIILWIYSASKKIRFFRLTDFFVPGVLIGQAIGRWGNFFNQEAFGSATTLSYLKSIKIPNFIIEGMNIGGVYFHPTFLYESLWCFVGLIIVLIIRNFRYLKIGHLTSFYFIWYGTGRYFIESIRTDSLMLNDLKVAQMISLLMIVGGLAGIIMFSRGSKLDNQYNKGDDLNGSKI